ncbi:MAG: DUF2157 domain-containing protein [Bacteroidota bacterium]
MNKPIKVNLHELMSEGILTQETAQRIEAYYEGKVASPSSRLTVVFGVLGAVLVGLGIILIVAHNWDQFGRGIKLVWAFVPVLMGQIACYYALSKQGDQAAWREGSAVFLFLALGACLAMISQIYNIQGSLDAYLLTWMVLCLPIVYLMNSTMASLLYIGGITWYACILGYGPRHSEEPYLFWLLLLADAPFMYKLYRDDFSSNGFHAHCWTIGIVLLIVLGMLALDAAPLMWLAYVNLLAVYFLLGTQAPFSSKKLINNPFRALGALGILILFLIASFDEFWSDAVYDGNAAFLGRMWGSSEIWVSLLLMGIAIYLLLRKKDWHQLDQINPLSFAFVIYALTFVLGYFSSVGAAVFINILLLAAGLFYLRKGSAKGHLGFLNLGLLILTTLIACRFFDVNISFVFRGILFVLLGLGFFFANYRILKQRSS